MTMKKKPAAASFKDAANYFDPENTSKLQKQISQNCKDTAETMRQQIAKGQFPG